MVKLYDPDTTITDRVEFENERVEFLTSIATLLANKARLKLNTKKLYASDGKAVQELIKLATLLYKVRHIYLLSIQKIIYVTFTLYLHTLGDTYCTY
jgi:hypothetical protein